MGSIGSESCHFLCMIPYICHRERNHFVPKACRIECVFV